MKKGLDSIHTPHNDSDKSLSRINPMCHTTVLKQVTDRRKTMNEKNVSTTLEGRVTKLRTCSENGDNRTGSTSQQKQ